ncbi:hypothetical protein C8J57DRAFT_261774 [Mycena rebaudengoi]|nr:hypothetical protein C8J57DRAFT_261774 [Mycena rebaudengoi]
MRVFRLEAFTWLGDATLLAIFESCPRIETVHLSGNDKVSGKVSTKALNKLAQTPTLAPTLKSLVLYDQRGLDRSVKALSKARPALWIFTGETLGNGISANMVAAMSGGASAETWLGGNIVNMDFDHGMYGPGRYNYEEGRYEVPGMGFGW